MKATHMVNPTSGSADGPPSGAPVWGVSREYPALPRNMPMFKTVQPRHTACGTPTRKGSILTNDPGLVTCSRCLRYL